MNSNVLINVATEYDNKGFKGADNGLKVLTKSLAKFTGGLALARKVQQSMLDAMADEKATKILANNLKSLGMAFAIAPAEQFIETMQRQTGVLDDELRPAYAQLARVTGDMYKTQQLLNVAWNTSSGTGEDFTKVVDALSQAYVGNVKGLKSLNLGLTQSELSAKSFDEVIALLNRQFGGAGAAAIDTYAGKMAVLQAAAADASETIGMSLLNSISTVSGSSSVTELADKINSLAENIGHLTFQASVGARTLLILGGAAQNPKKALEDWRLLQKEISAEQARWAQRNMKVWYPEGYMTPEMKKAAEAAKKRATELLSLNKKITAEKKQQTLIDKANALTAKAKAQFDLEGIQLAAALMNKSLSATEVERLQIKQKIWEIEQAQAAGDLELLATLMKQLDTLMKQKDELAKLLAATTELKSIFDLIGMDKKLIDTLNLEQALKLLQQMNSINFATVSGGKSLQGTSLGGYTTSQLYDYYKDISSVNPDMSVFAAGLSGYYGMAETPSQQAQDIYVTAIVEGNVMSQNDLAEAIRQQIQDAQQSGKDVNWARQALPATFL